MKYKQKNANRNLNLLILNSWKQKTLSLNGERLFKKVQRLDSAGRGRRKTQKTALIISELRAEYPLKKLLEYTGMARSCTYRQL